MVATLPNRTRTNREGKFEMTAVEHIIAWIESSREHYEELCKLEQIRKATRGQKWDNATLAHRALNIVSSAYREATRGGDMLAIDHSPETLLDAAKAILSWELEQ
jgi:hypothetical protein